jgi:hypothetical protein
MFQLLGRPQDGRDETHVWDLALVSSVLRWEVEKEGIV